MLKKKKNNSRGPLNFKLIQNLQDILILISENCA